MASTKDQTKSKVAQTRVANIVDLSDRHPLGGKKNRFVYVSQFYSSKFAKTYINVDVREYDLRDCENNTGKPTIKGVAFNKEEFEEFCRLIPTLKEELNSKLDLLELSEPIPETEFQTSLKRDHEGKHKFTFSSNPTSYYQPGKKW